MFSQRRRIPQGLKNFFPTGDMAKDLETLRNTLFNAQVAKMSLPPVNKKKDL
jgi:hypothetical protein